MRKSGMVYICGIRIMMKTRIVIYSAIAVFIVTAWFSAGYLHPDEHFQVLEFASLKLGIAQAKDLPWEYPFRMRPALQPAIAFTVHRLVGYSGTTDPFFIAFLLRLLSATMAFAGMFMIFSVYRKEISDEVLKKWFLLLSFLSWFSIFIGVRFASESWSGSFFVIGFSLLFLIKDRRGWVYFLSGLLMGFAFILRFPVFFMIAGLFLWLAVIRREKWPRLLRLALGAGVALLAGTLLDRWFYGEWTFTPWNYFEQNLLLDKISDFGRQPWWFYFSGVFQEAIPPFSIVLILGFLLFFITRRNDPVTWAVMPFLLFHFLLGHKETRFLYPLIGFIPVVVIRSLEWVEKRWIPGLSGKRWFRYFGSIYLVVDLLLLTWVAFTPADNQVTLFRTLYRNYPNGAKLYYVTENPYHRALDIRFYKRENLEIKKMNNPGEITRSPEKINLIVLKKDEGLNELKGSKKLIYRSYPSWIRMFNFNHWVERTNFWSVYELDGR